KNEHMVFLEKHSENTKDGKIEKRNQTARIGHSDFEHQMLSAVCTCKLFVCFACLVHTWPVLGLCLACAWPAWACARKEGTKKRVNLVAQNLLNSLQALINKSIPLFRSLSLSLSLYLLEMR